MQATPGQVEASGGDGRSRRSCNSFEVIGERRIGWQSCDQVPAGTRFSDPHALVTVYFSLPIFQHLVSYFYRFLFFVTLQLLLLQNKVDNKIIK